MTDWKVEAVVTIDVGWRPDEVMEKVESAIRAVGIDARVRFCELDETSMKLCDLGAGITSQASSPCGAIGWVCPVCGAGQSPFVERCPCRPAQVPTASGTALPFPDFNLERRR